MLSIITSLKNGCRLFTEAWIETSEEMKTKYKLFVASSRRRGLKHAEPHQALSFFRRLFTEAWIETGVKTKKKYYIIGRLFTEAWIETSLLSSPDVARLVASSRRRGLKQMNDKKLAQEAKVASSRRRGLKL